MSPQRMAFWAVVLAAVAAAVGYRMSVFREPPPLPVCKVAFVTGGSGPYWQLTVEGAKAAANEHRVDLRVETPVESENLQEQMAILERLNLNELDGIALSPIDAEGQTHFINRLVERNKRVVTFDSDAPLSNRQSYVGTSNIYAGATCARLVQEALSGGGKVAVLVANLTKENLRDRKLGFDEQIAQYKEEASAEGKPKFQVVGYLEDNGSSEQCAKNIRDVLEAHPDLACFVGMNARHGPILLQVLGELGKLGQITLITFDDAPETLQGIEAGHIYATMAQDPYKYGYEAVATLAGLCRGDESGVPIVGRGSTYVNAEPIRKDNLEDFRTRLRGRQKAKTVEG